MGDHPPQQCTLARDSDQCSKLYNCYFCWTDGRCMTNNPCFTNIPSVCSNYTLSTWTESCSDLTEDLAIAGLSIDLGILLIISLPVIMMALTGHLRKFFKPWMWYSAVILSTYFVASLILVGWSAYFIISSYCTPVCQAMVWGDLVVGICVIALAFIAWAYARNAAPDLASCKALNGCLFCDGACIPYWDCYGVPEPCHTFVLSDRVSTCSESWNSVMMVAVGIDLFIIIAIAIPFAFFFRDFWRAYRPWMFRAYVALACYFEIGVLLLISVLVLEVFQEYECGLICQVLAWCYVPLGIPLLVYLRKTCNSVDQDSLV